MHTQVLMVSLDVYQQIMVATILMITVAMVEIMMIIVVITVIMEDIIFFIIADMFMGHGNAFGIISFLGDCSINSNVLGAGITTSAVL